MILLPIFGGSGGLPNMQVFHPVGPKVTNVTLLVCIMSYGVLLNLVE